MNKLLILCVLAAVAAFPQAQTPLTITQSASSATGELRMQERHTNGTNYVGIKAPQSVAANTVWTLPGADGTDNQCLKTDGAGQWSWESCTPERLVSDYNWTQTIGSRSGSGAVTLTFAGTSCPAAGSDTIFVYRVYESSTPTTYELATSDGTGTCTRGGSGTIVATGVTGTYTNAIATSASAGFQEAILSVADGLHVRARAAIGSYSIYSPIYTEDRAVLIECESLGAGLIPRVNDLKVINTAAPTGIRVKNCLFTNAYATTGNTAIYADNPDGSNYGGLIEGNWFSSFDKSIHAATISGWVISKNHFLNSTSATSAIHVENLTNGDQGVGLIHGNIFTCGATCTYGLLWNGPGALQLKHNNFNGYTTQVHLQPRYGTASASGSTVTWQSGNKFRSILAGETIYLGSTATTIASVDSDTQITTASPIGTISTTDYYVNITSQLQISSNNFDSGVNTTKGIRWEGPVQFQNGQIEHNFFSNWSGVSNLEAISIASSGANFLSIRGNNIQSPQATTGTYGIRLTGGSTVSVTDNQIIGSKTAIAIESGASAVTLTGNTCRYNDTACITSAVSDTVLQDQITVAYADLAGLTVANSSRVYCSDCKQSTTACAGSGSGAVATRINSTWQCQDQTSGYQPWTVSGSDVYRSAGNVAIGSSPNASTLLVKGASGASGILELKHGTASSSLQLYAESSFSVLGTYTSSPLIFVSDSAGRWRLNASGMLTPETTDAYDIGTLTTPLRVRGIYGKIIDTALAGGTGDYLQTRKIQLFDNTGSSTGASYWDLNVVMSGVGAGQNSYFYLRDNAGTNVFKSERIASGSAVSRTTWYTDLLPDTDGGRSMGTQLLNWDKVYANQLGDASYPVVVWGANSDFSGLTTTALTINTGAATVGYVWTATSTGGAGSWQAASGGLPVVDTTGIAKGSSDATKIVRFEVDGFTSGVTNVLTPQNNSYTLAGTNITQTFVNPQTVAIASVQTQLTLSQTNATGAYDPACLTVAATDTVGSTVYGAGRLCGGYESASFTNEKVAIQTATGSGTYQDAVTFKNQVATFAGDLVATAGSFSLSSGTMSGTMKPLFNSTGKIGDTSYYYANGYFTTADIGTIEAATAYKMGGTTVINSSRNVVGVNAFAQSITFSAGSTYNVGSTGAPPLNVYGNYIEPLTELVMGSGVVFRGSLIPATNNTDAIGNTSFRVSNVATVNANISGTITAPSGSAGITSTKTVRDSAGTGTCTLIFSGGILTGGTC